MGKVLVCYFSVSGNTKKVAEKIAASIEGDLFEIEPVLKYTDDDLDWTNKNSRSSVEMNNNVKPEIVKKELNINDYDTVCLGFPIWWYKEPTIIDKFLDEYNMVGKKIYVFVTSGSSSVDSTYKSITNNYPELTFISGKRFTGNESNDEFKSWIG